MGPICPLCHRPDCYQPIPPYWRYAQELFPAFKKERIPVARFLCRLKRRTFSLLPIQLAPYCQYTLTAIVGALLLGLGERKQGQQGFQGAVLAVDPDSLVTPWLVACWLMLVLSGLKRAHAWLQRWYDLSRIRTAQPGKAWEEVLSYFLALDWKSSGPRLIEVLHRYSRTTRQFLFGIPSQQRLGGKLSR
jgi:hypothetical protein